MVFLLNSNYPSLSTPSSTPHAHNIGTAGNAHEDTVKSESAEIFGFRLHEGQSSEARNLNSSDDINRIESWRQSSGVCFLNFFLNVITRHRQPDEGNASEVLWNLRSRVLDTWQTSTNGFTCSGHVRNFYKWIHVFWSRDKLLQMDFDSTVTLQTSTNWFTSYSHVRNFHK